MENAKAQKQPEEKPKVWDMENLQNFFKLALEVDKRINPQNYEVTNND